MRTESSLPGARPLTLAEWAELPKEEAGELVDGRLVEDEDVGLLHDVVTAWLIGVLKAWISPKGGIVRVSDTRFGVSPTRGRKPDTYVYFAIPRVPAHGLVTVPPDIVVEVVSPRPSDARRDRVEKTAEYAAFGARYYWIVGPALRTLEIFELGADGRYTLALAAADGALSSVPGCDDLALDLDVLWAEADRVEGAASE